MATAIALIESSKRKKLDIRFLG